jgi:hypothetical protein
MTHFLRLAIMANTTTGGMNQGSQPMNDSLVTAQLFNDPNKRHLLETPITTAIGMVPREPLAAPLVVACFLI